MNFNKKSIFAKMATIISGIVAIYMSEKFIKTCAKKKQNSTRLGFNLDCVNQNANLFDALKLFKNEMIWGIQYKDLQEATTTRFFWSFDSYMDKLIIEDLRWMIQSRHGSPVLKDCTEENCHEKFTGVLKKMLYHSEQSQDEYCKEKNERDNRVDMDSKFIPNG